MTNVTNGGTSNLIIEDYISCENGFVGQGVAPLGTVMAIMPTGYAGSFLPALGQIVNGWLRCEGSVAQRTVNAPGSAMHGQVIPDLSGGTFLGGSTSSGSTGALGTGATSITLSAANLTSHAHDFTHSHSNTMSWSVPTATVSHSHSLSYSSNTGGGNSKFYYNNHNAGLSTGSSDQTGWAGGPFTDFTDRSWPTISHCHGRGISSVSTGGPSISMNHGHGAPKSGGICSVSLTATACGSTSAYSKMPTYIDVMFIMRVV